MDDTEQLVMLFSSGDGYTYCCDNVFPIRYTSCEAALVDFEELVKRARAQVMLPRSQWDFASAVGNFTFAGREFSQDAFYTDDYLVLPEFLTVDEWFARDAT